MPLRYRPSFPRRQVVGTGDDLERGMKVGSLIGKLLGGAAEGYQDLQKNIIANRLMNTADAPRAALVSPGGQTVTTPGGGPGGVGQGNTVDPNADLSTDLPEDVSSTLSVPTPPRTFSNPATGNVEPLQGTGGTYSGTNTDPLASAVTAARLNAPTTQFVPNVIPAGVSTAGTRPHTGGTTEMALQKEMLALQLQKAAGARAAAEEADREAERQGTGRFALDAATKRLQLAKLQVEINKANAPAKPDKNAPPENIDSEPVRDTGQLSDYVDNQYGNGTYNSLVNSAATSASGEDLAVAPTDPNTPPTEKGPSIYQSNPDGTPKYNPDGTRTFVPGVTVPIPVGGKDAAGNQKTINMPLKEAQTYVRQTNLHRIKQGLPPFRVPGEEQDVGATPDKPFIAHNKMEAQSRAPGTYVRLPDGQVVLWQGLKRTK